MSTTMVISKTTICRGRVTWCAIAIGLLTASVGSAQEFRFESAGVRGGFSGGNSSSDFHQAEAFVDWELPWRWDLGAQWNLQTRLDLAAGWLGENDLSAGIFSLGPILALERQTWPVGLEGGISPTLITRTKFDTKDIGVPIQFTSHIGIYWDFAAHLRLGYRYQHMSNAGFSSHNPGVNQHLFSLSYTF